MDIHSTIPEKQLMELFLRFYNTDFWVHKARTLQILIEDEAIMDKLCEDDILKRYSKEELRNSFEYELAMMAFHSSEALFGLIFAYMCRKDVPWGYLHEYKTSDLYKNIRTVSEKGLAGLLSDPAKEEELITWLFFPASFKHPDPKEAERIKKGISFVKEYLPLLAKEFLEHDEYNCYKHGFRAFPLNTNVTVTDEDTGEEFKSANKSCIYLSFEPTEVKGVKKLSLVSKAYSYKKALAIVAINASLMKNITSARKQMGIDKKTKIEFTLFDDKSAKDIFKEKDLPKISKFKLS